MPTSIKDHDKLHESVVRATLAGGAAAVLGSFIPATLAMTLSVAAIGCAIALPLSWASAAWALWWAIAAGAGARLGGPAGNAIEAIALGVTLARGTSGSTRWTAAGLGAIGALTAGLITRAFAITDVLSGLPSGIATLVTGATSGLVIGVASIGRHIEHAARPIEGELRDLTDDSELGQLLGRAAVAYREAVAAIGDDAPAARAAADEMVHKMTRFGRRWRELETEAARSLPAQLHDRLALVGRKLSSTTDPLARVELTRAAEALKAQVSYLDEIANGRERAVARLTHQVATLERLRLAALRQRSADAGRLGAELQPVVEDLAQAGGDFDTAAEAMTEALGESMGPGTLQLPTRSIS